MPFVLSAVAGLVLIFYAMTAGALVAGALIAPANTYRFLAYNARTARILLAIIAIGMVILALVMAGTRETPASLLWGPPILISATHIALLIMMSVAERISEALVKAQQQ